MNIQRLSAFSTQQSGGNPAGVIIADELPDTDEMQSIANEIGYSESVFAAPLKDKWRVRYFSPESEVPFCGHATIALGAALAMKFQDGEFSLQLNNSDITVTGAQDGDDYFATLESPPTKSTILEPAITSEILSLLGYVDSELDSRFPPAFADAGATHFIITLRDREKLAAMSYDLDAGRKFMRRNGIVTIAVLVAENPQLFHARNAFASGGVLEDPATGAAAAAFCGYLRDISWPHDGSIRIIQGEDMGRKSEIFAEIPNERGAPISISGAVSLINN